MKQQKSKEKHIHNYILLGQQDCTIPPHGEAGKIVLRQCECGNQLKELYGLVERWEKIKSL